MLRTHAVAPAPFLTTLLFAVLGPLLIVMATAFLAIPWSLAGHPGETRVDTGSVRIFHLT